jgi:uncharacterized Zn-finger protein
MSDSDTLVSSANASAAAKPVALNSIPANAENRYTVTHADLPLSCPMPEMTLWNSHPKVYLPVEANGTAKCPYCGAQYTLAD